MPILAGLIGSLFGGLASFFAQFMAKKAAFAVAAVAAFTALTVALVAAMQAMIAGVVVVFPETNGIVLTAIWVALPDSATTLIGMVLSADAVIALYRWNVQNLQLASYVS